MMATSVPQAVQSCHDLLLWLIPQLDECPRSRRFTLGERLEAGLLDVLELLVEAAYTRHKEAPLRHTNLRHASTSVTRGCSMTCAIISPASPRGTQKIAVDQAR